MFLRGFGGAHGLGTQRRRQRRGADAVSADDFTRAVERIVAGIEKRSRLLNPHKRHAARRLKRAQILLAVDADASDEDIARDACRRLAGRSVGRVRIGSVRTR